VGSGMWRITLVAMMRVVVWTAGTTGRWNTSATHLVQNPSTCCNSLVGRLTGKHLWELTMARPAASPLQCVYHAYKRSFKATMTCLCNHSHGMRPFELPSAPSQHLPHLHTSISTGLRCSSALLSALSMR
jgi:hypothetical protein